MYVTDAADDDADDYAQPTNFAHYAHICEPSSSTTRPRWTREIYVNHVRVCRIITSPTKNDTHTRQRRAAAFKAIARSRAHESSPSTKYHTSNAHRCHNHINSAITGTLASRQNVKHTLYTLRICSAAIRSSRAPRVLNQ